MGQTHVLRKLWVVLTDEKHVCSGIRGGTQARESAGVTEGVGSQGACTNVCVVWASDVATLREDTRFLQFGEFRTCLPR